MPRAQQPHSTEPVDPDPLTAVLAALGALGGIASLSSLPRALAKNRGVREIRGLLVALEVALQQLEGDARALDVLIRAHGGRPTEARRPIGFGRSAVALDPSALRIWQQVEGRLWQSAVRVQRAFQRVLFAYARTAVRLPPSANDRLERDVEQLNNVLIALTSVPAQDILAELTAIIASVAQTVHLLQDNL
jgi:hypothetical protein